MTMTSADVIEVLGWLDTARPLAEGWLGRGRAGRRNTAVGAVHGLTVVWIAIPGGRPTA